MKRVVLLIMDSLGIGSAPDAARFVGEGFTDEGSDTLGHIAETFALAGSPLILPNLARLGLLHAYQDKSGSPPAGTSLPGSLLGSYARAREISSGKDTPSGHWEIAGVPALFDWSYFPRTENCFPRDLLTRIAGHSGVEGFLGNCHASGTEIISRLGEEHLSTGYPIYYTSSDSVFQVAAHEEKFGLERLLNLCRVTRSLLDESDLMIGRVIARPFTGSETLAALARAPDQSLVMTNFVEFDALYGHRRDVLGYGRALQEFDTMLPQLFSALRAEDLLIVTADHGNDPTWPGTDHTREEVPVLLFGSALTPGTNLGARETFADIGQTIADFLGLPALGPGTSLLS